MLSEEAAWGPTLQVLGERAGVKAGELSGPTHSRDSGQKGTPPPSTQEYRRAKTEEAGG